MLYLTRKIGESIIINNDIEVVVVDINGKSVKLGFNFPAGSSVLRKELHEKVAKENLQAINSDTNSIKSILMNNKSYNE